jgi:WD40 repeat protein
MHRIKAKLGIVLLLAALGAAASRGQPAEPGQEKARTDRSGDPLPDGALTRLGTTRFRVPEHLMSLAFTPDGRTLVTGSYRGYARVWDAATGKVLRQFGEDEPAYGFQAALSTDGKRIAVGSMGAKDLAGSIYEVATGRRLARFGRPAAGLGPVGFLADGKVVSHSRPETKNEVYEAGGAAPQTTLAGHTGFITAVVLHPDGKTVVSAGEDDTVRFWDAAGGKEKRQLTIGAGGVWLLALSPDGSRLAVVGLVKAPRGGILSDRSVRLWDVAAGKELRQWPAGPDGASLESVAFTPDGKSLLTVSDNRLSVWDPETAKERRRFADSPNRIGHLAIAPDGKTVAVLEAGSTICLRDLATGRERLPTEGQRGEVLAVAVAPDGRTAATGGRDRIIYL